jgi:DNA-binding transcriptional LysR family regulator
MDINHLIILKKVADAGGFTAAAKALGLPKSSISQKISQIEQDLGVRLLQRTTRRISLTEIGEQIYEAAGRILSETEDIQAVVQNLKAEASGHLRVTAPMDLGIYLIEHALKEFSAAYPKVTIELDLTNRVVDLVKEGFDLALRASTGGIQQSSLVGRPIAPIVLVLFATPQWLKEHGPVNTVHDLKQLDSIFFTIGARRNQLTANVQVGAQAFEILMKSRLRLNDIYAVLRACIVGHGVAFLPEIICRPYVEQKRLVRILPECHAGVGNYYALYPSRKYLPNKTRVFLDFLSAILT